MATNIVTTITTTMRNLFCFFSERRGRYKRRSECEFPSDTREHPSEKNTPSERERESTRRKRRRRRQRQRRGRRRAVHLFFESRVCRCDFWKNEKRERKTIQTTHQFIFFLLLLFVSRVCDDTTTTTGRAGLFLSLAYLLKRERERERE